MVIGEEVDIWTETFGSRDAPGVLLIAGAHAPSIFWPDFFCEMLADAGFFVMRYDHRDIGYSTHFPPISDLSKPIYSLDNLAGDALAILDHYKIERAHVIGHSMGGSIVQYLAAFHSERVLRSISMSVSVDKPTHQHPNYTAVMEALLKNKPRGDFEKDWKNGWERSLRLLSGEKYQFDEEMARNYVKTIYERHTGDFNPAWNQIAAQQNKRQVLHKLPSDMLLINGTEDIFSPYKDIENLAARFNTAIIHGAGHMFFNKNLWEQIFAAIIKFLI